MLRIVCLTGAPGGIDAAAAEELRGHLPEIELVTLAAAEPLGAELGADGLISTIAWPGLGQLEADIPWVHIWGTGVEAVPAGLLASRTVTCARGASGVPIAEFVLACMLAFEKQLPEVWIAAPPTRWYQASLGGLSGKSLAVLGLGGIGAEVARLGSAFGMSVTALRRHRGPAPLPGVELVEDVAALVDGAHHVVVAAPATPATRHIIGRSALAAMRPGVHLVNVARGSLVDHEALRDALDAGQVARACLDTTDPEPLPAGHWLFGHPRVRLSPHVSWSSDDAGGRLMALAVDNLRARLSGAPLPGLVDPAEGY